MSKYIVSAPGKMMITGEYAVLEGAEALVTAVGRRAYAMLSAGAEEEDAPPPEAAAARAAAERMVGVVPGQLSINVDELRQEGTTVKLGLGSSAAAAAAAAGAVFAAHGRKVTDPAVRQEVLAAALEGHRAVAPHGSGADVAAAVLGGFVRFRKLGEGIEAHPLAWPTALELVVIWTGTPARTNEMLGPVRALANRDPAGYRDRMRDLGEQAEQLISALMAGETASVVESFHAYGGAMGALGEAAGVGIIDNTCSRIRALATQCGGGAKPSGAGGGDVAIAVFSSPKDAKRFRIGCDAEGFEVLSLELGEPGERDEEQW